MLARANRITTATDFSLTRRRSRRVHAAYLTVFVRKTVDASAPARFGFVVPNTVGHAVTRNRLKRQLREIAYGILQVAPVGYDVVIQASDPRVVEMTFAQLEREVTRAVVR